MRLSKLAVLAVGALASGAALAQGQPPSTHQACRASAITLCKPEVIAGDRAAIRACMIRNFDKASPDCQAAMKAAQAAAMGAGPDAPPPPAPSTPPKS